MGSVNAKFVLHRHAFSHVASKLTPKIIFTLIYLIALGLYLLVGLQPSPADASGDIRLQIPSIGLATPVDDIEKTGQILTAPARIAGAYHPSENKIFLIGHSSTVFHNLDQATTGDTITFDNAEYTITEMETRPKSDIAMTAILKPESEPTLILMTCAGDSLGNQDYTHRLIITAHKI